MTDIKYDESKGSDKCTVTTDGGEVVRAMNVNSVSGEVIYDKSKGSVQSTVITEGGQTVRAMNVVNLGEGGGGGDVDYNRVVEKTASALPTPTAELAGKAYMYVGETRLSDDIVYGGAYQNGSIYECVLGTTPASMNVTTSSSTIEDVNIYNKEAFLQFTGMSDGDTVTFTYVDSGTTDWNPTSGEVDGLVWSIADTMVFNTALHTAFPNVDYSRLDNVEINYNGQEFGIILWTEGWSEQLASANNINPADYGVTVDTSGYSGGGWTTFNTYVRSVAYWDYNGEHLTQDELWSHGLSMAGTPSNNDTISVSYTAAQAGYVWSKLDDKWYKLPELVSNPNRVVQLVNWQDGRERYRFYASSEVHHDSQINASQTAGSGLTDLFVDRDIFGNKVGWPDHDVDVVFKFVETTQTTGNVTYNLRNIQATIDLNTFYSALKGVTTVDMANMYKPEYADGGWQIAYRDQDYNWGIIAQGIDPAQWGITITSGTPEPMQDSIEVYFTAFGGDQWGVYIDETLQETGSISDWGIFYSGTPVVGDEITGVYKTWYTSYVWQEVQTSAYSPSNTVVTLAVDGWQNNTQTVHAGVSALQDKVVIVSPTPESIDNYTAAGIKCTEQHEYTLTFTCTQVPQNEISVNIVVM